MEYFNTPTYITELATLLTWAAIVYIKSKFKTHKNKITSKIVFFVNILLNILLITCLIFPLFILISLFIYESKIDKFFILAVLVNVIIFFLQIGYILYFK